MAMNGPATDNQQALDITNMTLDNRPDTYIHLGPGIQTDLTILPFDSPKMHSTLKVQYIFY